MVQGQGTVTFTLNGVPRWVIDVSRFGGTPNLTVTTTPQQTTTITLKNARFPGTQISADFVLVVGQTGPLGTPGDFAFTFGGFHGQVIFEQWLAGNQVMQATVTLHDDVCPLGTASKLAASGSAHARFLPSWLMAIRRFFHRRHQWIGAGAIVRQSPDPTFVSNRPEHQQPSQVEAQPRCSRCLQERASGNSHPVVHRSGDRPASCSTRIIQQDRDRSRRRFDGRGVARVARHLAWRRWVNPGAGGRHQRSRWPSVFARAGRAELRHRVRCLHRSFTGRPDVSHGALRAQPRLARGGWVRSASRRCRGSTRFGSRNPEANGDIGTLSPCAHCRSCADERLPRRGRTTHHAGRCVAADCRFVWHFTRVGDRRRSERSRPAPNVTAGFSVSMLRRDDLLALDFLFFNLALEAGGGNPPQIVRKDPSQPSYLVARFNSPQNIAEQAYLEEFPDTGGHPAPPGGNLQNFGAETPGTGSDFPPIAQTRAAGPSRLAFRLPTGTDALPFSLDDLLSWAKLEQSVVPVAAGTRSASDRRPRAANDRAAARDPGAAGDGNCD